jgi:hypothetical protein
MRINANEILQVLELSYRDVRTTQPMYSRAFNSGVYSSICAVRHMANMPWIPYDGSGHGEKP